MRKIFAILTALFFVVSTNAYANGWGVGVTGSLLFVEASGTESDGTNTNGTETEASTRTIEVDKASLIGSGFLEYAWDATYAADGNGITLGVSYTPGSADVSGSKHTRTDSDAEGTGDDGSSDGSTTYTAAAEVSDYINYYVEVPVRGPFYIKGGLSQIDVTTQETGGSNTGTYPNSTLDGLNLGIGVKGGSGSVFYKAAYEMTNFDDYSESSSTGNKVTADLDTTEFNISVGYRF